MEELGLIHTVNNNTPSLPTKEAFYCSYSAPKKELSRNKNAPGRGNKSMLRNNKRRKKVANSQTRVPQGGGFFLFKAVTQSSPLRSAAGLCVFTFRF